MKDDAISRSSTLEHVQRLDHLATLPDGDFVVRLSEVEDAIVDGLPPMPPERDPAVEILNDERIIRCKSCEHYVDSMCSNLWMLHAVSPEDYCSRARLRT